MSAIYTMKKVIAMAKARKDATEAHEIEAAQKRLNRELAKAKVRH